jgi:hypothetical protein
MDARDALANNADLWAEYFRQQSRAGLDRRAAGLLSRSPTPTAPSRPKATTRSGTLSNSSAEHERAANTFGALHDRLHLKALRAIARPVYRTQSGSAEPSRIISALVATHAWTSGSLSIVEWRSGGSFRRDTFQSVTPGAAGARGAPFGEPL